MPCCFETWAISLRRGRSTSARWQFTIRRSGPTIPYTATSLAGLALLLQAQGELGAAQPLFERALAIYEKALGRDHPDTAAVGDNLTSMIETGQS